MRGEMWSCLLLLLLFVSGYDNNAKQKTVLAFVIVFNGDLSSAVCDNYTPFPGT